MCRFFHGWRRKIGVVTLAMSLALKGLWIRGNVIQDSFWFGSSIQSSSFSVEARRFVTTGRVSDIISTSSKDGLVWGRLECKQNLSWIPGWKTFPTKYNDFLDPFEPYGNSLFRELNDYHWQLFGIDIGRYHVENLKGDIYTFWRISHLSMALPLALISACLLLPRTHPRASKKVVELAAAKGG